jgi:hypothetical protein
MRYRWYVEFDTVLSGRREEVTRKCRTLHNDLLNVPYSSHNIFCVIKSRRMRWAGLEARMREARDVYRVLMGKLKGKRPLGRPRIDGRISRWIFRK